MHCGFCGARLPEDAFYCLRCGNLIPKEMSEAIMSEDTSAAAETVRPSDPYSPRPSTFYGPPPPPGRTQSPFASPSSHMPVVPPPPPYTRTSPPITRQGISRRTLLTGLAALTLAGGGALGWRIIQHQPSSTPTPLATLSPLSTATPPASPTPTPTLGMLLYTYRGHSDIVYALAWSPDSKRIASGGNDKTVQVWHATDGGNVFTYRGHSNAPYGVGAVAWSPDGKRIASGSNDNTVQVWNATDGGNVFTYRGHSNWVRALAWSPDGKRIVSGSADNTMQVWGAR